MNATPEKTTDQVLDGVALAQYFWKPGPLTTAAVEIVKAIMVEPFYIWPDEVKLEQIDADSRNCIGSAYRVLANRGIIEATGEWRRSHADGRHGGKIFQYRISNVHFAQEFVRRNSPDTKIGQLDLPGTN
jgi:hypothetical protein